MSNVSSKSKANEQVIRVSRDQLPVCCPQPEDESWNMHPRVYLPVEKTGESVCPYCGARFVLQN